MHAIQADNIYQKIKFIRKFLNQSIHELEECQRTSTRLERYHQNLSDISIYEHQFTFKNQTVRLKSNELVVHLNNVELLDRLHILNYKALGEYVLTMEEYERCFNRRLFIFVNGKKILDDNVDVILDMNKSLLVFRDLPISSHEIASIDIIKVYTRKSEKTSEAIVPHLNGTQALAFDSEGEFVTFESDEDGNIVFNNTLEKEIYHLNHLKYSFTQDIESNLRFFQLQRYLSSQNVLLFKDNVLQHDKVISHKNTIYEIKEMDLNANYSIVGFDLDDRLDDDLENYNLNRYLIDNPDLLQFYVHNMDIENPILNIDNLNYVNTFTIQNYQNGFNADIIEFVDYFYRLIIANSPDYFDDYITTSIENIYNDTSMTIDDIFIESNLRQNVSTDIPSLDIPLSPDKYVIKILDYDDQIRIYVNNTFILNPIVYGDGSEYSYAYIDADLIKSGDIIYIFRDNLNFSPKIFENLSFIGLAKNEFTINLDRDLDNHYDRDTLSLLMYIRVGELFVIIDEYNSTWLTDRTIKIFGFDPEIITSEIRVQVNGGISEYNHIVYNAMDNENYEITLPQLNPFVINPNGFSVEYNRVRLDNEQYDLIYCEEKDGTILTRVILKNLIGEQGGIVTIIYNPFSNIIYNKIQTGKYITLGKNYNPKIHRIYVDGVVLNSTLITLYKRNIIKLDNIIGKKIIVTEISFFGNSIFDKEYIELINNSKEQSGLYSALKSPDDLSEYYKKYISLSYLLDRIREGNILYDEDTGLMRVDNKDEKFSDMVDNGFITIDLNETFENATNGSNKYTINPTLGDIPRIAIENRDFYGGFLY